MREKKVLLITIDAGAPEYFINAEMPNIRRMVKEGFYVEGNSVIPSVTNVNNVSIITGSYPKDHGVTSNYWYDKKQKKVYMESPQFICTETIFQKVKKTQKKSALLTSKDKLRQLLGKGADISISAENPPLDLIKKVGPPQNIYSPEINLWLFRALNIIMKEKKPDFTYTSTTDYVMHKYAPNDEVSLVHMAGIDAILGEIIDENPNLEVYITADHGMSPKRKVVDLKRKLTANNIEVDMIPIIKDGYVQHHRNLGGSAYLCLNEPESIEEAIKYLQELSGVDEVYTRQEAAEKFQLMSERIGDLFVLASWDTVFGELDKEEENLNIRSHGSRYESRIPIIVYEGKSPREMYHHNFDVVKNLEFS